MGKKTNKKATTKGRKKINKNIKRSENTSIKCKVTKELRARHLASICAELESLRGANGRIPKGALSQVYNLNKRVYDWLSVDIIKKCLNKRKSKESGGVILNTTIISDLTDDSNPIVNVVPPPTTIGTTVLNDVTNIPKKGGRPKGSTILASRAKAEQIELLKNQITAEWGRRVESAKGRMEKNELDKLIMEKKEQLNLTDEVITKSCIRQRIQKKY